MERTYLTDRERYDRYFKNIIRRTDVLAQILRTYVDEFRDCSLDEIKRCIMKEPSGRYAIDRNTDSPSEGGLDIRTDTLFRVKIPNSREEIALYVNIEGQNRYFLPYPLENRAEAYVSQLITSQKGREFKGIDYGSIKKVYSIWILFRPPSGLENTIIRYDRCPKVVFGNVTGRIPKMDLTHIIMVHMGPYDRGLPEPLALVSALFSEELGNEYRFRTLSDRFNISFDDEERREVEGMLSLYDSFVDGYENALKVTSERRFAEGELNNAAKNIATLVCKRGMTMDEAFDFLCIEDEERDQVRERAESIISESSKS